MRIINRNHQIVLLFDDFNPRIIKQILKIKIKLTKGQIFCLMEN